MSSAWGLSWGKAWANSWGLISGAPPTRGGANYDDYKKYAKKLKNLAKLADKFNERKYIKQVSDVAQAMPEINVAEPILAQIAKTYQAPDIDAGVITSQIRAEIDKMLNKLQALAEYAKALEREEEEMVILLCI